MAVSRTSFTPFNQPSKRVITSRRGMYWRAIPLEAFSIQVRLALAAIPPNQWWLEIKDPDDLDLVEAHLKLAQVIEPRPYETWQVRHSCRHLIHKARQWAKRYAFIQTFSPEAQERFNPYNESLDLVERARKLYDAAFPAVPDVFPGCPAAYAKLRGLR